MRMPETPQSPPAKLYVVTVYLVGGPTPKEFDNREISRKIEIRGDQTLERLHDAVFEAFDRHDAHLYEFHFGKRPFDPDGRTYGSSGEEDGDARTAVLDDLKLEPGRVFGYRFDFGDEWFHRIRVEKIDRAIPTVDYPRITRRVGKSPPQYADEE